jgi:eukaryotic-like serine/threonine-protein kinase
MTSRSSTPPPPGLDGSVASGDGTQRRARSDDVAARMLLAELRQQMFGQSEGVRVGRFELRQRIGRGAFGSVFLADDPQLQRRVAIKLLNAESDTAARTRLLREAQALARLKHPNVLTAHDVGVEDERIYVAMEYVEGGTLTTWCHTHPPSTRARFTRLLALAIGAARGLAAAHGADVLHRDIKPDNILIGDDGRPRIADFGLARALPRGSVSGEGPPAVDDTREGPTTVSRVSAVVGTPAYMAPEQFDGRVDAASDQFALCATLWEAAYGERPFVGDDAESLQAAKKNGTRAVPPERTEVPRWWRDILARGLAAEPTARWPTVAALALALERATAHSRLRRLAIAGAVVVAVGLLAVGAWGLRQHQRRLQCSEDSTAIAQVWDDAAELRLRASLLGTGISYAQTTIERAVPRLSAYTQEWRTQYEAACASRVDGVIDDEQWQASRRCFDFRRRELSALLVALTERPDGGALQRTVMAVARLPRVGPCTDPAWLAQQPAEEGSSDDLLRERLWRALALDATGRYDEAHAMARELAEAAAEHPQAHLRAAVFEAAGRIALHAGDFDDAQRRQEAAFDVALAAGESALAFKAATNLAFLVGVEMAHHDEGLVWTRVAAALHQQVGSAYETHAAEMEGARGSIHWARGEWAESERSYHRLLALEEVIGREHPVIVMARYNLATVYEGQGRWTEAEATHTQVLALREQSLGPDHPDVATSLAGVGNALYRQNRYVEAERVHTRGLRIREAAFGAHHEVTARQRMSLANIYLDTGRVEEAERAYEHVREDFVRALGPTHPKVAGVHINLAKLRSAQGRFEDSERELERALEINETAYPNGHPHTALTAYNLGYARARLGKPREAEAAYSRSLAIHEQYPGTNPMDVSDALHGRARVRLELGRDAEAADDLQRAIGLLTEHERGAQFLPGARFLLARAWWSVPEHRPRAHALAVQARDDLRAAGESKREEAEEVERWLVAHPLEATEP